MSDGSASVFVSNVSPSATEKTVSDFFSFCGRISQLFLRADANSPAGEDPPVQCAVVVFESPAAAKTALLLTNALIIDRAVQVALYQDGQEEEEDGQDRQQPQDGGADATSTTTTTTPSSPSPAPSLSAMGPAAPAEHVTQRDFGDTPDHERSQTSVVASLMAAGYTLSTDVLQKASSFDQEHGFSARAQELVDKAGAKARAIDEQYQISAKATAAGEAVKAKAAEVDEQYKVSEKARDVGQAVAGTAAAAAAKAQENETVAGGVIRAKAAASAVSTAASGVFADYKAQTEAAIAARQAERLALEGSAGGAAAATAAAQPVEPLDAGDTGADEPAPLLGAAPALERPGAMKGIQEADDESRGIAGSVRSAIEAQATEAGMDLFAVFELVCFAKQVVAGTNYFLKLKVQDDGACVHARVFRSLQGEVELHSIQAGKLMADEIEYF